MASQTPEPTAPPSQPVPPPPPGPEASRAEWHAWRRHQRDYERAQTHGWYGSGWRGFGWGWFWGALLVVLGIYFLLNNLGLLGWVRGDVVWPVVLILLGVALIVGRGRWWR
jgi:hypothetical protein